MVLIGHEVDDLTTITDAIANRTDTTTIAVSPSHFAVSSKDFTSAQLNKAEQSASQASDPVEAASKLITSLQAQRRPGTSSPKATTTKATAKSTARSTAASTGAGGVLKWDRFQLPDGSIACMIASNSVRCDVLQHTYTPPKNPNPNCEGDYGAAVQMTAKDAPTFICISDTVADPSLPKLTNGATTQVGDVMCFSDPPSITCLNVASVHGFLIQPDTVPVLLIRYAGRRAGSGVGEGRQRGVHQGADADRDRPFVSDESRRVQVHLGPHAVPHAKPGQRPWRVIEQNGEVLGTGGLLSRRHGVRPQTGRDPLLQQCHRAGVVDHRRDAADVGQ